jgi:hypothetical protein
MFCLFVITLPPLLVYFFEIGRGEDVRPTPRTPICTPYVYLTATRSALGNLNNLLDGVGRSNFAQ